MWFGIVLRNAIPKYSCVGHDLSPVIVQHSFVSFELAFVSKCTSQRSIDTGSQQLHGTNCTLACPDQHHHQTCAWRIQLHSASAVVYNSSVACCATLLSSIFAPGTISFQSLYNIRSHLRCSHVVPTSFTVRIMKQIFWKRFAWI